MAARVLQKNMQAMNSTPPLEGVKSCQYASEGNIYVWDLVLQGPPDSPYAGMDFKAQLKFPKDFPMNPPELRIMSPFWHPNVYPDGKVCMTILHAPKGDMEDTLRWSPVLGVDKIIISFISLLWDPDPSEAGAPANVDALREWRHDRKKYIERCIALGASAPASATKGAAVKPSVPPHSYKTQVAQLRDMGIEASEEELVAALKQVDGDITKAVNALYDR